MKKSEIIKVLNKLIAENSAHKFDDPIIYLSWFIEKCLNFFGNQNELIFMNMQYISVYKRKDSSPIMRRLENLPNLINAKILSSERIFQTFINILAFSKALQIAEVPNSQNKRDVGTPANMMQQNFILEIISQAEIYNSNHEIEYNPVSHILTVALPYIYDGSVSLKYYEHLRGEFNATHTKTTETGALIIHTGFFENCINNFAIGLNEQYFAREIERFFKRQDIHQYLARYERSLAKLSTALNIAWNESQQKQFIKMCFLHAWLKWVKYTYQIPIMHVLNHQDTYDIGSFLVLSQCRLSSDLLNSLQIAFNFALNAIKDYRLNENQDSFRSTANHVSEPKSIKNQVQTIEEDLQLSYQFESIVGHHPKMLEILKLISQVADTDVTVLIQGESGTGKELVAQAIHFNSRRSEKPMVCINCGAIPENLLESELFGHEKGAFTGAWQRHRGKFEQADGGTIFLDEVDEMSPALQVKLLRILQWGDFSPLGSETSKRCNVRLVAAAKVPLKKLVDVQKFRDDLYYRLNLICIDLPPLRERKEDLPLLCNYILHNVCQSLSRAMPILSSEAQQALEQYDFPGNIRELENILTRAVILCEGNIIRLEHLPSELLLCWQSPVSNSQSTVITQDPHISDRPIKLVPSLSFQESKKKVVADFERGYIQQLLAECDGNIRKAAERAGMYERNFHLKLKRYGIQAKKSM